MIRMPGPPHGRGLGPRSFLTEEEKKNRVHVDRVFLKRILSYLKPYRLIVVGIILVNLIYAGTNLLPPLITGQIVDRALYQRDLHRLLILVLVQVIALAASSAFSLIQRYMNSWLSQQIIFDMKNQMYSHLQKMPLAFFTNERQGDIITRMTSDIEGIQSVISDTLTSLVSNILVLITTAIALFSLNWRLALIGISIVPLMQIPSRLIARRRWQILREAQEKKDELNQHMNETLSVSGALLVKLYTREDHEERRFFNISRNVTDLILREQKLGQQFMLYMQMFREFGPILIYLFGGLLLILGTGATGSPPVGTSAPGALTVGAGSSGNLLMGSGSSGALTVGTIIASVALITRLYSPVSSLLNIQVTFTRSFALFDRIFSYFDMEIDIKNGEAPVHRERVSGDIVFDHVDFHYQPEKEILKDICFTIPKGNVYALVGPSGAGKTTVASLIPRLFDTVAGTVSIDGVDIRDYDLTDLRRSIGIVTQDTYLFNGTIRENLLYAKPQASEQELSEACRMANIHDFIMSLPDQYDSVVGNRGLKLSGGEKQRISIARVILKDPDILILDEATSSLDSIAERQIQDAIEPLLHGRTCLIIAHRLSTILSANQILVLEKGHLLAQGTHEDLLKTSPMYRRLYETQFRTEADAQPGE